MRGCGLRPVGRRGSARRCGDPPFWILGDGVNDTCTKDTVRSNKQDLAFRDACFRSSGHDNSFQIELTRKYGLDATIQPVNLSSRWEPLCYFSYPLGIERNMPPNLYNSRKRILV